MEQRTATLDPKLFGVGVLSITAVILFVGFLLLAMTPRPAVAESMNDRGGDFIMTTHRLFNNREGVMVMDAASKQMVLYLWEGGQRQINMVGKFDFGAAVNEAEDRGKRRRRR